MNNVIKLDVPIMLTLIELKKERCPTVFGETYHFVFETENNQKFRIRHFEEWEYPSEPLKDSQFMHIFEKEHGNLEGLVGNRFLCKFEIDLGFKDAHSIEHAFRDFVYDIMGLSLYSILML